MKKFALIVFAAMAFVACKEESKKDSKKEDVKKETTATKQILFEDIVEMDNVEAITVHNNSGSHDLTTEQIGQFKTSIAKSVLDPDISLKMGGIGIDITISGETYNLAGRTHGEYVEMNRDIATKNQDLIKDEWMYFKLPKGTNFDNYQ